MPWPQVCFVGSSFWCSMPLTWPSFFTAVVRAGWPGGLHYSALNGSGSPPLVYLAQAQVGDWVDSQVQTRLSALQLPFAPDQSTPCQSLSDSWTCLLWSEGRPEEHTQLPQLSKLTHVCHWSPLNTAHLPVVTESKEEARPAEAAGDQHTVLFGSETKNFALSI